MKKREMVPSLKKLFKMTSKVSLTPVMIAENKIKVIRLLEKIKKEGNENINLESSLDAEDANGYSLLHNAIFFHNLEMTRNLIEAKCDLNKTHKIWGTPVSYAEFDNQVDIAALLIKAKCDLNQQDARGESILLSAVYHNHLEITKLLIEAKCHLNYQDIYGNTALITAVFHNYEEISRSLIEAKCDLNIGDKSGDTALIQAIFRNNLLIAQQLIIAAANVNQINIFGKDAFYYALEKNDLSTLALLLSRGSQINSPITFYSFLNACKNKNNPDYWICLEALFKQQKNLREIKLSDNQILLTEEYYNKIAQELDDCQNQGKMVYALIKKCSPLPDVLNHMVHEYDTSLPTHLSFFKNDNTSKNLLKSKKTVNLNEPGCCLVM